MFITDTINDGSMCFKCNTFHTDYHLSTTTTSTTLRPPRPSCPIIFCSTLDFVTTHTVIDEKTLQQQQPCEWICSAKNFISTVVSTVHATLCRSLLQPQLQYQYPIIMLGKHDCRVTVKFTATFSKRFNMRPPSQPPLHTSTGTAIDTLTSRLPKRKHWQQTVHNGHMCHYGQAVFLLLLLLLLLPSSIASLQSFETPQANPAKYNSNNNNQTSPLQQKLSTNANSDRSASSSSATVAASTNGQVLSPPLLLDNTGGWSSHHRGGHFHMSKFFLSMSSTGKQLKQHYPLNLFNGDDIAHNRQNSPNISNQTTAANSINISSSSSTLLSSATAVKRPRSLFGRKRKRELFTLTFADQQPLKTIRPNNFWTSPSVAISRQRRMNSRFHQGDSAEDQSNISMFSKRKKHSQMTMSELSSFALTANLNGPSSATAGNHRLKIMLNPPGFGGNIQPDGKCNYEIYPSGCFDENGSVCDTSGSGKCICRPGYSIRIGNVYCLRPATIGEACYTTEQCERKVSNSGCFNFREEYREENPSAFFGPSQSSWPMGECRCRIGFRYAVEEQACIRSMIGSWCSNVWDCGMAEEDPISDSDTGFGWPRLHGANHSGRSLAGSSLPLHGLHSQSTSYRSGKLANIVCEHNTCNCSQFFHYNQTSEECEFVETYGQACQPQPKRNARHQDLYRRWSKSSSPYSMSLSMRRQITLHHNRQLRSLQEEQPFGPQCNMPSVCSENGTCVCAKDFEYQPSMTPQCQSTKMMSHLSSIRSGTKDHSGGLMGEGHSNVANFMEYVLYVLVPALVVIFIFRPCFRRIGAWRNHIHQYQSDSDFYMAANGLRPVLAEMNVIPSTTGANKKPLTGTGTFTADELASLAFAPHLGCHSPALLFEPTDSCFAAATSYGSYLGASIPPPPPPTGPMDPSLAAVRERLQTIEESQAETDTGHSDLTGCIDCAAAAAAAAAASANAAAAASNNTEMVDPSTSDGKAFVEEGAGTLTVNCRSHELPPPPPPPPSKNSFDAGGCDEAQHNEAEQKQPEIANDDTDGQALVMVEATTGQEESSAAVPGVGSVAVSASEATAN